MKDLPTRRNNTQKQFSSAKAVNERCRGDTAKQNQKKKQMNNRERECAQTRMNKKNEQHISL